MTTQTRRNGTYRTGLCAIGACEGKNPKNFRGEPLPTCQAWDTCSCGCHEEFDKLFELSDMDRTAVNNSSYAPPERTFWMPSIEDRVVMRESSTNGPATAPTRIESPVPDTVPATLVRAYAPTPSGRSARGELESWVKETCDVWLVEKVATPCTPTWISVEIGRSQGIKDPSVGAIAAVFDRWTRIGFALVEKKPTRFVKYTEEGIRLTLQGCYERERLSKKRGT